MRVQTGPGEETTSVVIPLTNNTHFKLVVMFIHSKRGGVVEQVGMGMGMGMGMGDPHFK
jgi:hypothetical protein